MKVFLAIAAAIGMLYGVAFLLIPEFVLGNYGITTNDATVLMGRLFGLTLLGFAVSTWFVRETTDGKALRGLLMGLVIQAAIGVVVSLNGTISATMNVMGWSAVVIYAVLFVGYLYCFFANRAIIGRV
jgi:hypothetical protein